MTEATAIKADQVMVDVTGIDNNEVDLQKLIAHLVQRMTAIEAAVFAKQEEQDAQEVEADD